MRLFLSLNPDPAALAGIREEQRRMRAGLARFDDAVRWTRHENTHLTLVFLGERETAAPVEEALAGFRFESFDLRIGGPGIFPDACRPAVLWLGIDDPGGRLARLQAGVEAALSEVRSPEDRPFHPHLTLGRVRPSRHRSRIGPAVSGLSLAAFIPWRVRSFFLMESRNGPEGVSYSILREFSGENIL